MDDTRIETPEDFAARILGTGNSVTQIEIRKLAAEVIRARDAGVAAWCERKAAEANRSDDEYDAKIDAMGMRPDPIRARCRGVRTGTLRFVAATLAGAK